ncbi:MAG: acyl carrier protein [Halobacteriovoraceae bacterium]|jgi:acyl carrier protein|nr:acyl carrier protein [Halobacteriovoraceae bacterium]
MNKDQIYEKIKMAIVDCADVEQEDVKLSKTLIDDLGVDSIDMMELIYSLEKSFGVQLEIGDFEGVMSKQMGEVAFAVDNIITTEGLEKLRSVMPEVDQSKIVEGLSVYQIPFLFTVESLCNLVIQKQK